MNWEMFQVAAREAGAEPAPAIDVSRAVMRELRRHASPLRQSERAYWLAAGLAMAAAVMMSLAAWNEIDQEPLSELLPNPFVVAVR